MNRLIPAALIITIVFALHFGSQRYIERACATTIHLAEQCEEEWLAGKDCNKTVSELKAYWNKIEYGLSFFVNHDKLSSVELEIKGLSEMTDQAEDPLITEHIRNLYSLLGQIRDDTAVNFKGIV